MKNTRSHQSGNALWFVLLGIALLSALTLTITNVSDTTEETGDIERARIHATEILRFATSVEKAIDQMRLRGISESDVSFDGPSELTGYNSPNCTTNDCLVFHVEGGGIEYQSPPEDASTNEWLFTGENTIYDYPLPLDDRTHLIMAIENINQTVCERINIDLGISGIPGNVEEFMNDKFVGSYGPSGGDGIGTAAANKSACMEGSVTQDDIYYFYNVLITRQ